MHSDAFGRLKIQIHYHMPVQRQQRQSTHARSVISCSSREEPKTIQAHIGAIAVQEHKPASGKYTRLDVEFVCVDSQMVATAVKPSVLVFGDQKDETVLSEQQKQDIVTVAGHWVHKTHVTAAAKRQKKREEMKAIRDAQLMQLSHSQTRSPTNEPLRVDSSAQLSDALSSALSPLIESVTTLQNNQMQMANTMRQQPSTSMTTAQTPDLFAPSLHADSAVLATAFAHSQMGALHLAQQSLLLSSLIAPAQLHAAQNMVSSVFLGQTSAQKSVAPVHLSDDSIARGRKRRRK
jgi:hypothetical protein